MGSEASSNKRTVDPRGKEVRLTPPERFALDLVRRAMHECGYDPKENALHRFTVAFTKINAASGEVRTAIADTGEPPADRPEASRRLCWRNDEDAGKALEAHGRALREQAGAKLAQGE